MYWEQRAHRLNEDDPATEYPNSLPTPINGFELLHYIRRLIGVESRWNTSMSSSTRGLLADSMASVSAAQPEPMFHLPNNRYLRIGF